MLGVSYFLFEKINGFNKYLSIELIGDDVTIEVGQSYEDMGAKAFYHNKDISDKVKVNNDLDNSKLGTYSVEYIINYRKCTYSRRCKDSFV